MPEYRRILIATDFSDAARAAAVEGARLARSLGSEVILVHAVEDHLHPMLDEATRTQVLDQHRAMAAENLQKWSATLFDGVAHQIEVEEGAPADTIRRCADRYDVDVIVVASRGHSALGGMLLGSTADRLVRHSPCPVLVVPAEAAARS